MPIFLSTPWSSNIHTTKATVYIQASSDPSQFFLYYTRRWIDGTEPSDFAWQRQITLRPTLITLSTSFSYLFPDTLYNFQFKFSYNDLLYLSSIAQFRTLPILVETSYAQNITSTGARLYGNLWSDSSCYVYYYFTVVNPITGVSRDYGPGTYYQLINGWKTVSWAVSGLTVDTRYLFRLKATNTRGGPTFYGEWRSFRTGIYKVLFRAFAVGPDQKHYYGEWKSFDRPF